ncbi:MAG: TonB-dependent receptor [Betaproteobacteria bacterium]|nr:TonB-dependent receptor [Betaproteobacteria bacterium]
MTGTIGPAGIVGLAAAASLLAPGAWAQTAGAAAPVVVQGQPVVVTATRVEESSFDVPASIDSVGAAEIREQQPRVNLSESLGRVPGLVIQNRQNYAQDLQISSRGFGARAAFGVRGVRLIQDGIPLTMPDGQGQAALFDLDSAARVEVLRGPFAALYGNSSGGVIQLFTENAPREPTPGASLSVGSYRSWRETLKFGATDGALGANGDLSRFSTDGYRDHSAATRYLGDAKLRLALAGGSSLSLVVNELSQPWTQDPLGLTRAQLDADRRQAGTGALQYNTRKNILHRQAGLVYETPLSAEDSLKLVGYGGERYITQYQAFSGSAVTSSGGVVDLNRGFGGASAQWRRSTRLAGVPFTLTAGIDYDLQDEQRTGFVNNNGVSGALRRNEDDRVHDFDQYVQFEWQLAPRWKLSGGLRHSQVAFGSKDFYIVPGNGDDSGSASYSATNPVAGLLYQLDPAVNLYASVGRGFETPTFTELAYRPDGRPGLNFGLQPARSTNYEAGVKAFIGAGTRLDAALFQSDTRNDIVSGPQLFFGRSTYVNAAKTLRRGLELSVDSDFGRGLHANLAYTYVDAKFEDYTNSAGLDLSGRKLPGVPANSLYGEISWRDAASGLLTALEARWGDKVYVDDANSDAASAYAVFGWRAGFEQRARGWKIAEFLRIDNLFDRRYVGSVIVNASNAQYYEPAPGRNYLLGVSASYAFR